MDANKILSADILDIIFEGKNKSYGAYQLRKNYNKTLTKALIITGSVLLLIFLGTLAANVINKNKNKEVIDVVDTQMAEIKKDEPPPPPPPRAMASCENVKADKEIASNKLAEMILELLAVRQKRLDRIIFFTYY